MISSFLNLIQPLYDTCIATSFSMLFFVDVPLRQLDPKRQEVQVMPVRSPCTA